MDYKKLISNYGDTFYLLDSNKFKNNYIELKNSFAKIYDNFNIAYSYKTNYIPKLCKIINELGGYAEVVSEMELDLARKIRVDYNRIIWNGPIKNTDKLNEFLVNGGIVNIDNLKELYIIKDILSKNKNTIYKLGVRCNYDVGDGVLSRFGFDVNSEDFNETIKFINNNENIDFVSIQCHFAKRDITYCKNKIDGLLNIIDKYNLEPKIIDVGGGLYGKMEDSLKKQFDSEIPNYQDYANIIANAVNKKFKNSKNKPLLFIEPGSALVGDCMKFISTIKSIKNIRGKYFATTTGSQKNISMQNINPPIEIIHMGNDLVKYKDLDFVGYTCIESDVLYHNYCGELAEGDLLSISNCGSYSIVMKPPFILPNFPIIDISNENIELVKKQETFDDVFRTYIF